MIHLQQSSAVNVSEITKDDNLYEEMLKTRVLFRVCIARTVHYSELAPAKRSESVVSATSLKVQGHQSAGVGIEFKIIPNFPLPVIISLSPYGRAVLSGNIASPHFTLFLKTSSNRNHAFLVLS